MSKRHEANARLYDAALGRFLSPDPYVQMPDFSQNFNRYSYCLNNPLRYTDPEGEFIFTLICTFVPGMQVFLPVAVAADAAWMTDYALQVATNHMTNKLGMTNYSDWEKWFGKVDWFDVGMSALVGGATTYLGPTYFAGSQLKDVKKIANIIKYGSPFITNGFNWNGDGSTEIVGKDISLKDYLADTGLEIGSSLLTDLANFYVNDLNSSTKSMDVDYLTRNKAWTKELPNAILWEGINSSLTNFSQKGREYEQFQQDRWKKNQLPYNNPLPSIGPVRNYQKADPALTEEQIDNIKSIERSLSIN